MAKQHLKLAKEIQSRDYDALVAHTTIVFMRYMFLAYQICMETDHRTFGDLFYACCEEQTDISFIEALHRIMILVVERVKQATCYDEKTISAFFEATIEMSLKCLEIRKCRRLAIH